MAVDVVDLLRELDVVVTEGTSPASWLFRTPNDDTFEATPSTPVERLTTRHVWNTRAIQDRGVQLLVGASATTGVVSHALAGHIHILTEEPLQRAPKGVSAGL